MMDYISTRAAAAKWGLSPRQVQRFLQENRIPGAKKYGNYWMIPAGSKRPADLRRDRSKGAAEAQAVVPTDGQATVPAAAPADVPSPYLTCVLLSAVIPMAKDNPDAVLAALPDEGQRAQYRAELDYLRGNFDGVKAHYRAVSTDDPTYLCAANIAICAAMCTRDYALFKEISAGVKRIETESPSRAARAAASLLPVLAAVCMNAPNLAPDWLIRGDFEDFSLDARPMLIFMRVKYLQSVQDHRGMLAAAQTARALYRRPDSMTLTDIYFTCFCACGSYAAGQGEAAQDYLFDSLALCEPGGFVSPLGEYTTWVGGLLERTLKQSAPSFAAAVNRHVEGTLKNWLFFHNEFARDNASLILTTKEYQLALLLKEGKTYAQAAERLGLSVGRVKNLISVIYGKLGVSKKAEISRFVY